MKTWTADDIVINVADADPVTELDGQHWGSTYKVLTPTMRDRGGKLGIAHNRLPPGRACCPFHTHQLEDEVFYVLEGRGVLRYGDTLREIGPGDCVTCPAGTGVAHQIANPFDADLVYLAIGPREPNEICTYPDSGKVMVRPLKAVGLLERTDYMHGEGHPPPIFAMFEGADGSDQ